MELVCSFSFYFNIPPRSDMNNQCITYISTGETKVVERTKICQEQFLIILQLYKIIYKYMSACDMCKF